VFGGEPSPADELFQKGSHAYQRGAFDQAIQAWTQASAAYEKAGDAGGQAEALLRLAEVYLTVGQSRAALQALDAADRLVGAKLDSAVRPRIRWGAGRVYAAAGQFADAEEAYADALRTSKARQLADLSGGILNDLANLYVVQEKYDQALAAYDESLAMGETAGNRPLVVRTLINAATCASQMGRYAAAKSYLDRAFTQAETLELSHDRTFDLITMGLGYHKLRRHSPEQSAELATLAYRALEQAAKSADALGDTRAASYAWGYLGSLYEEERRYPEALDLTRRAIFLGQQAVAPEALFRWHWQDGRLLKALNRMPEAIEAYRRAVYALQTVRPEQAVSFGRAAGSFRKSFGSVYYELADLLLRSAEAAPEQAQAEALLRDARDTVELSKVAELRDYFQDECVDAARSHVERIETVSKTTAVLYPIVFPDRMELLVSLPTGLKRVSVPVPAPQLTQEVRAFRRQLENRTTREFIPHAQQLYDWLIRSLEGDLAASNIDTLVFVPDGPLRSIPMAALHDGKQFLISKYAVATTPGLTLTDPRPLNRERVKVLSSGLTESVQGYPPLPHVTTELRAIRTLYGGDQLVNKDFLVAGLEKELKENPVSVLHIASHGRFEKDVAHSFILAFDDKLTMAKLDQYVGLFRFRQEPLELLTLSACETAVGDDRAALGLAGVAIKAGARSALATLWSVNDEASSSLVAEFYLQLRDPTVSKAVALQRAQVKLLADSGYEHPAYWSPFLLLNNWL
jgi:CHAT domain-containing protein/Tfp pilus assembly protein PilF